MMQSPACVLALTALLCKPAICQESSIEQWIAELDDAALQQRAADALVRAGEPAVLPLVDIAADDSASDAARTLALCALAEIGPAAAEHAAELRDLGPTLAPELFVALWRTLAQLAPYAELELGMEHLTVSPFANATPEQQRAAMDGWWRARARRRLAADASVEELIQHLEHEDAYLRELAAELLVRHGAKASAALPALEQALNAW